MREIFKYGSVGRAPGNRCLYLEVAREEHAPTDARSSQLILDMCIQLCIL